MIAAIVQARMGSTRLPNKVLKDLCGRPLVWQVINRVKASRKIDKIILATTQNPNDAALENWAGENDIPCYRGSEDDVLDRFYNAARLFKADVIVRITPDDPFKDPAIIDQVIDLFEEEKLDFAYNNKPATFPEGLDTEVFSFQALERAWTEAKDPFEREHVTQYFYRHPELFRQKCLIHPEDLSYLRWTIDTQKDWDMAEMVYKELFPSNSHFSMADILELLRRRPEIALVNADEKRSAMYNKGTNNNHGTIH
ncbi:MAG: glycosyltransferase family protein [Minisyncoccia bacterium]